MYKKNEKAFIHDLSRFMTRNNVHVRLTANWHHVPVGAFQLFLAVHERGGFHEVIILPVQEGWLVWFMAVSFIGGENHRPATSHRQTLSHNVI
jgi:hypothetical protein